MSMQQFDQAAERYNAALSSFRTMYEAQHPMPVRQVASTDRMDKGLLIGLILTLLGAVIVSASHTIPVFVGSNATALSAFLAFCTFVMIEAGIVTYAFFHVRRSNVNEEIHRVKALARRGLFGILMIALGANVKYVFAPDDVTTLGAAGATLWNIADFAITGLVAFSAPLVAFVTGELLAIVTMYEAGKQQRLDDQHRSELAAWHDSLLEAWRRDQRNWGVKIKIEKPDAPMLTVSDVSVRPQADRADGQHGYGKGYARATDARTRVLAYLASNPSAADMNVRDLAAAVGVGKTVAAEVLREWRAGDAHAN